jgi:hypothetical protein
MDLEQEAENRMGSPVELATSVAAEYRGSSWVRRHPALVFAVAPLPLVILAVATYLLSAAAAAYALEKVAYGGSDLHALPRSIVVPVASAFTFSIRFVPFLVLAAGFGWLALRCGVGKWWLAAAVLQIALLDGIVTANLSVSDLPGDSKLMIGLDSVVGWLQAVQLVLPLVVGWIFLRVGAMREKIAMS